MRRNRLLLAGMLFGAIVGLVSSLPDGTGVKIVMMAIGACPEQPSAERSHGSAEVGRFELTSRQTSRFLPRSTPGTTGETKAKSIR
jgi:hypothetical protein